MGVAEDPVNNKDATQNLVDNKLGEAENPANVKEIVAENPIDDKGRPEENPIKDMADCLPDEATQILKSLASEWENVLDANALQVIPLKGAMTNEVFQIKWQTTAGETSRKVLARIYGEGTDIFFDRDDEIRTFEFISKNGQGPRLLGRFAHGRIEEFIRARTLSASDLRDPSISALIATKMKEFHDLDMPGPKKVLLWERLRNWLSEARRLCSPEEVETFHLDTMDKEISSLENELSGTHQRIGFCHNDLQYGNFMLDEENNSVTIIDYEYSSYNPVAYDIANHFSEMVANYHTETPHVLDYSKYPDLEERKRFVYTYLSSSGQQPSDSEVQQLVDEVEKYTLANHLLWGVWGIISEHVNKIDFDYKEYAKQRFQEYWSRKKHLLSSDESSHDNVTYINGEQAPISIPGEKPANVFRKLKKLFGLGLFRSKH
uniref:Choline kinase 2 n=1 Tax=Lotus japonicus TaxID=34305 RepID=I3SA86_LOTJA|nr:unknown [Lotus japonicus]